MADATLPLPRGDSLPETLRGFMDRFSTEEACADSLRRRKYGSDGQTPLQAAAERVPTREDPV